MIPGRATLDLEILLLDLNGTLTERGELIEGVEARIAAVRVALELRLLSADTFGTLEALARRLDVRAEIVSDGSEKLRVVEQAGPERCVAIGNGANDVPMLGRAALGIAVVGPEGASTAAVAAADIVCRSIGEALDLLSDPRLIAATLRP